MGKIKYILWDIDGTVLNFLAAEKAAIRKGFARLNLGECTDAMLEDYSRINVSYWEKLERGELTKPVILVRRFADFFKKYGLDDSLAEEFNSHYQVDLGDTICFNDNAYELITQMNSDYVQCAVTNGTKLAQRRKLKLSGLDEVFAESFISDEIGYEKPSSLFFDAVFDWLKGKYGTVGRDEVMIIGDSLTSDIKGGNNAGIKACWYNPFHKENTTDARPDSEIDDLHKLEKQLKFPESPNFMRLGMAITQNNQNIAMMIVTNLQKAAEEAGLSEQYGRNLNGIRQCIIGGDTRQALDILALVTAKRLK